MTERYEWMIWILRFRCFRCWNQTIKFSFVQCDLIYENSGHIGQFGFDKGVEGPLFSLKRTAFTVFIPSRGLERAPWRTEGSIIIAGGFGLRGTLSLSLCGTSRLLECAGPSPREGEESKSLSACRLIRGQERANPHHPSSPVLRSLLSFVRPIYLFNSCTGFM